MAPGIAPATEFESEFESELETETAAAQQIAERAQQTRDRALRDTKKSLLSGSDASMGSRCGPQAKVVTR